MDNYDAILRAKVTANINNFQVEGIKTYTDLRSDCMCLKAISSWNIYTVKPWCHTSPPLTTTQK